MRRFQTRANRSGVTLIELLVVATMMLTLAAVSVPAIKPMMESQLTSNAASTLSTYLNRARARAMTTGRPCGVTLEYFPGSWDGDEDGYGSVSLVLRQVETPPYYSGLDAGASVSLLPENDGISPSGRRVRQITNINDPYWKVYVANESTPLIQFNGIGSYYPIVFDAGGAYIEKLEGVELPACSNASFKVIRNPRQTMTAPVGLPQGAVVDLEFSGTDESGAFALGQDVTIVFSPSGEVDYVVDGAGKFSPTGTIYFLVGRWDRISALGVGELESTGEAITMADDGLWNYEDATNFWVTVNPRTGLVATTEVNPPVNYAIGDLEGAIFESRDFARTSKRNLGGH